jgi:rhamnose utilization protein RhaD (predicted bifunctional aldolase and dehydrogenase)
MAVRQAGDDVEDRWDDTEAAAFGGPLGQCVYGSRLIGRDPDLVLHGGGNTSIKAPWQDIAGDAVDALYVKGSGWDLATIEPAGFTPLPLTALRRLLALDRLPDAQMAAALAAAQLDASAPAASVETLLHALLPHRAVLHSHADVIVALTNLSDGDVHVRQALGSDVVIAPYVMPGFDLAKAVARLWPLHEAAGPTGMVLSNHGLFTFADTMREAYARHADLITRAERYLDEHAPRVVPAAPRAQTVAPETLADLRQALSQAAGAPMVVTRLTDALSRWFAAHPDVRRLSQQGPLTPDHVIRTKRVPMLGTDVAAYVADYRSYFAANASRSPAMLQMLDPSPRVVIDADLGVLTAGRTAADAGIAADIYRHTMAVIARAEPWVATAPFRPVTCSTSSTGTSSKPSCAGRKPQARWQARWRW